MTNDPIGLAEKLARQALDDAETIQAIRERWTTTNFDDLRIAVIAKGAPVDEATRFANRLRAQAPGDLTERGQDMIDLLYTMKYNAELMISLVQEANARQR